MRNVCLLVAALSAACSSHPPIEPGDYVAAVSVRETTCPGPEITEVAAGIWACNYGEYDGSGGGDRVGTSPESVACAAPNFDASGLWRVHSDSGESVAIDTWAPFPVRLYGAFDVGLVHLAGVTDASTADHWSAIDWYATLEPTAEGFEGILDFDVKLFGGEPCFVRADVSTVVQE